MAGKKLLKQHNTMQTIEVYNTSGKPTHLKVGQIAPKGWMVLQPYGWQTLDEDHAVMVTDGGDYEGPATKELDLVPVSRANSKPAPSAPKAPEPVNAVAFGEIDLARFLHEKKYTNQQLEKSGLGFRKTWTEDTGHSYYTAYSSEVTLTEKGKLLVKTAHDMQKLPVGQYMNMQPVFQLVEKMMNS